jgi:hypothetical protein
MGAAVTPEARARKWAHSIKPVDLGSAEGILVIAAAIREVTEEERARSRRWKRAAKKWRHLWNAEHQLACEWGNDLGMVNNLLQRMKLWRADIKGTHNRVRAALEAVKEAAK